MEYNPVLPAVQENPYPYYAYLRRHAPVYHVPDMGFWAVSRYDDVLAIFRNPHLFSSAGLLSALMGDLNPFPPEAPELIGSDPPYHTRLRKLANKAFTPRRVASLEQRIREVTGQLIEQAARQEVFDLVKDFSAPLPTIVIAELLGIPPERYTDFKGWTDSVIRAMNGMAVPLEERAGLRQSMNEMFAYLQEEIARYRQQPGDNLLSDLVRAEEENQILSTVEILSLAAILVLGGSETTTNLIGNAVLALLAHPEQLAQVRANLALVPNVLEETVRYDNPIQTVPRRAVQETVVAGTTIPAGSPILPLIGSANRDERKFPDPERFDMMRDTEGHLGFGSGIHYCIGAQLARLEARVALETLLGRFPRLAHLSDRVARTRTIAVRGPRELPLMVG